MKMRVPLIYNAKKWRDLFGGNINEYLPIGTLVSPESYVLYEIKTGGDDYAES